MSLNMVSLNKEQKQQNDVEYLMIYQICVELELDYEHIVEVFREHKFNSQLLMQTELSTLLIVFDGIIDKKNLCMMFMKKEQLKTQIEFYKEIETRAQNVEERARIVAEQVNIAKLNGKLHEVVHEGKTYFIEDPENGNGLCEMVNGSQRFLSRRTKFRCHRDPCAVVEDKNIVYCLLNKNQ